MRFFLQVPVFLILALAASAAEPAADAWAGYTARQEEILRELEALRPAEAAPQETPWMLGRWDSDAGLASLVVFPGGEDNAAVHFRRLEDLYSEEKERLERGEHQLLGVDELLAAAAAGSCRFTPEVYPEFISVEAKQPDFAVLRAYLQALQKRAESLERAGDPAGAERCHRAALLCGRHLTADNYSALVYMTGLIFKVRGAQGYEGFLRRSGRTDTADAAALYLRDLIQLLRLFNWKANVALSEMAGFACLPAVIRIAFEDREVCWRKEALARLAVLRHGVPDPASKRMLHDEGFETLAQEALARASAMDPDISVRRLAVWLAFNIRPGDGTGAAE